MFFFLSCCLAQMTLKEFYNIKYTFVKSPQLKRKVEWVKKNENYSLKN